MKNFIEIVGVNRDIFKINVNHITSYYKPNKPELPLEKTTNNIFTRITLSCGTEYSSTITIEELEQLINKKQR